MLTISTEPKVCYQMSKAKTKKQLLKNLALQVVSYKYEK